MDKQINLTFRINSRIQYFNLIIYELYCLNMKTALISIMLLIAINSLYPQKSFTLEECINFATKNSPSAIIAKSNFNKKKLNYSAYNSSLLPQLSFRGSIPGLNRSINETPQPDGTKLYIPQSQLYSSAALTMSQVLPFSGTQIYLSSGLTRFDVIENNGYSLWRASPLNISITQPIFTYNNAKWNKEIQDLNAIKFTAEYAEEMEMVSILITQKFFDLYIAQMNVKNAEFNVANGDTLLKLSQGRFSVGKIAENDLLQSELALLNAQNELEYAKLDFKRALEDLKLEMGYHSDSEIEIIPPLSFPQIKINTDIAIKEALENRPKLTELKLQKLEADSYLARVKSDNSFNATIGASFGYNQSAGEINSAYKSLLDQESFDISIQIPIYQFGKGSQEIESALENQRSVNQALDKNLKNFELDVKYQALKFDLLQNQLILATKADTIASKRFDVAKNRYIIGKIDLNSLFIAQNEKDNAFRNFIQTMRNYWLAYFELRRITLFDFEQNRKILYN